MLKKFTKISKNVDLNNVLGEYVFLTKSPKILGKFLKHKNPTVAKPRPESEIPRGAMCTVQSSPHPTKIKISIVFLVKITNPLTRFQKSIRQVSRPNFARNTSKKPLNLGFQKKFSGPNNP